MTSSVRPRPLLGLICCARQVGAETAQAVMERYVEAASRYADCAVVLVPARPDLMTAKDVAARLDGLLLTGSPSNVEPSRYDRQDDVGEGPFDPGRDTMSLDLIQAMLALGRPVFGICRGFQELNVAFGGSLRRDLAAPDRTFAHHAPTEVTFDEMFDHSHPVALRCGGILARALGAETLNVNSVHFQGVDRLGDGLQVEAIAEDGVIEAFSATVSGAQVLAVQWHPEWRTRHEPASRIFFETLGMALRAEADTCASAQDDAGKSLR